MAIYLIPNTLGESPLQNVLPAHNADIIRSIKHFIVEDVRTARRFLKKVDKAIDIDTLTFYTLNQHTRPEEVASFLNPARQGLSMGIISEAGCPAIADPGADVVAIAQRENMDVRLPNVKIWTWFLWWDRHLFCWHLWLLDSMDKVLPLWGICL